MFNVGRSMFDVQKKSLISYHAEFIKHKMEIPILSSYLGATIIVVEKEEP